MANPAGTQIAPAMTTVTVPTTAGGILLIGENPTRNGLVITNRGANVLTFVALKPLPLTGPQNVPVAGAAGFGIDLAAGESIVLGPVANSGFPFPFTAAVQGITVTGAIVCTISEF
jgi:hypothetical protein